MKSPLFNRSRRLPSNLGQMGGVALSLAAASVLVLGFGKIARMDLEETALFLATLQVVTLAAVFTVLAVVTVAWGRKMSTRAS